MPASLGVFLTVGDAINNSHHVSASSSGIPDFRSSDGLYNMMQQRHPGVLKKGSDLFDATFFRNPTTHSIFLQLIAELKTSIDKSEPSPTHHFIQNLNAEGRLLRSCVSITSYSRHLNSRQGTLRTSTALKSAWDLKGPPHTKHVLLVSSNLRFD